jgi:hypothetical protein
MERNCQYRNCGKELPIEMKKDAKFCCRSCKQNELKYKNRKKALLDKYAQSEMKRVEDYKKLIEIIKGGGQIINI